MSEVPAPRISLKVLVADGNPKRGYALSEVLRGDASLDVTSVPPGMALIDAVRAQGPDVVLVDMERADRDALDSVLALSRSDMERPVALFVDEDDAALMETAFDTGICSYNVMEALPRDVKPLLRAAIALYARFRRARDELTEAQRVLAERAVIEQAKRYFMKSEKASEAQAHRWLQRRAMQTSRRIATVAEEYLAGQRKEDAP